MEYSAVSGVVRGAARAGTVVRRRRVSDGDLVIFFQSRDNMSLVKVAAGEWWSGRPGSFKLENLVGKPYGSKVFADKAPGGRRGKLARAGWVVLLEPSPQLWTVALQHRTQIIYQMDIALITLHLEIGPGSVVYESGTGSGSMSTSLAQAICPHGRLFTFEYNQVRADAAVEDFRKLGIGHVIEVTCRNIVEDGFILKGDPDSPFVADAVFLDLPAPWKVVESAKSIMRDNAKFSSFSPCIEQVQRTCLALEEVGFIEIVTVECLNRTFDVKQDRVIPPPFDEQAIAPKADDGVSSTASPPKKKAKKGKDADAESDTDMDLEDQDQDEPAKLNTQDWSSFTIGTKAYAQMKGHTSFLTFARKPLSVPSVPSSSS